MFIYIQAGNPPANINNLWFGKNLFKRHLDHVLLRKGEQKEHWQMLVD